MHHFKIILFFTILLFSQSCESQNLKNRISILVPTIDQEASSIWRTINDIDFFEMQGYNINLPKNDLIDSLITKSKDGTFGNDDFSSIYGLLESEIFNKEDYNKAYQKVLSQEQLINDLLNEIIISKKSWDYDFKIFESYNIVFTLYGTGGSYNPENGTVTLLTTKEGDFVNYKNPANTIIHEIVHLGIEESIVQKNKLPHGLKERIVDTIVFLMFKKQLPNFQIQKMGDIKFDDYLKQKEDLKKLNSNLAKYLNEK